MTLPPGSVRQVRAAGASLRTPCVQMPPGLRPVLWKVPNADSVTHPCEDLGTPPRAAGAVKRRARCRKGQVEGGGPSSANEARKPSEAGCASLSRCSSDAGTSGPAGESVDGLDAAGLFGTSAAVTGVSEADSGSEDRGVEEVSPGAAMR